MPVNRYPSPLRYPGGKGKVANYLKLLLLENGLLGVDYVEPYAGGSNVALSLLYEEFVEHIHINDINRSVYAFWYTVLNYADQLCAKVEDTPVTVGEWYHQRETQAREDVSTLDLGFSTFFLNRTNRSGIISGAGVIGGQGQKGTWKIDARYDKDELCRRIQKVARFRTRIKLSQLDAVEVINQLNTSNENHQADTFAYLDPPYYIKARGLYDDFYDYEDHLNIAHRIRQLGCSWVVSYDSAPQILALYKPIRSLRYSLSYSASQTWRGSEVMFFSPDLAMPAAESAAGVSAEDVVKARQYSHL